MKPCQLWQDALLRKKTPISELGSGVGNCSAVLSLNFPTLTLHVTDCIDPLSSLFAELNAAKAERVHQCGYWQF